MKKLLKILMAVTMMMILLASSGCGQEEGYVLELGHCEVTMPSPWTGPLDTEPGGIRYIQGLAVLEAKYYEVNEFESAETFVNILYRSLEKNGFTELKKQDVKVGRYPAMRVDALLIKEDGKRGPISCYIIVDENQGVHYLIAGAQMDRLIIMQKAIEQTFKVVA